MVNKFETLDAQSEIASLAQVAPNEAQPDFAPQINDVKFLCIVDNTWQNLN